MTQPDKMTSNPETVSTITKHIKIYSDNPIHDCIDRIITACTFIDESNDPLGMASTELFDAAEELSEIAMERIHKHANELNKMLYEKKPN